MRRRWQRRRFFSGRGPDAGLNPDHSCKEGVCGACETKIISAGEIIHRDGILTKAEQAANKTMMICVSQCKRGPLVLDI